MIQCIYIIFHYIKVYDILKNDNHYIYRQYIVSTYAHVFVTLLPIDKLGITVYDTFIRIKKGGGVS